MSFSLTPDRLYQAYGEITPEELRSRGITMLLEVGGMVLFGTILRWNPWLVKIGLNVLVLVLNYVFSKLLVFQKKK